MDGSCAGNEIGCRPNNKEPCCWSGGKDGKACPFHKLTKIVGRGDIAVEALLGQIMTCVARLAQMTDDMVGVHVYRHSQKEHHYAHNGIGTKQVGCSLSIGCGRKAEQATTLQYAVYHIEDYAHKHDGNGHSAFALHEEGKDE